MQRIHKHADSCNIICNIFLSGDLAFANITTNMLIMWKGFRAKQCERFWWGKSFFVTGKLEECSVPS